MNLNKHLLLWGGIASLLLSGCQDEDFGFTEHEIRTKTSFEKHFGEIDPDQIWDFSSYNLNRLGLGSNFNQTATTRAAWGGVDDTRDADITLAVMHTTKWYEVPTALQNWMDTNLREEVYNKKRGTTHFTLTMPTDRDIVIIPIYQGQAGLISNLCIHSEEGKFDDGAIWHKSQGLEVGGKNNWAPLGGQGYYDYTAGKETRARAIQLKHYDEAHPENGGIQGKFSLYLDILNLPSPWNGNNGAASYGETFMNKKHASSNDGQMVALSLANDPIAYDAVRQALIDGFNGGTEGNNYGYTFSRFMIIGCEDSNMKRDAVKDGDKWGLLGTDWDMNDMVFLIAGLSLEDITTEQVISKRYMIEDLGASGKEGFDYDFNDIVIDVKQTKVIGNDGKTVTTQRAYLRHLCGTIPWKVKIGNTEFPIYPGRNYNADGTHAKTDDPGYDPTGKTPYGAFASEDGIEITGWDPDANNIFVTAWPQAAGEDLEQGDTDFTDNALKNYQYLKEVDGTTYTFPRPGQYPFIIACDVTTPWSNEHNTIESTAIVTWKRAGYETTVTPGSGTGGGTGTGTGEDNPEDGISSVSVPITIGGDPVELNIPLDSWADDILINPEFLQNITPGDIIRATIEPTNGAKMMYLSMKSPWKSIGDNMNMGTSATTFEVVVTPDNVNELKAYGIALKGVNVTVKSIQIISAEWTEPEKEDPAKPVVTWNNQYDIVIGGDYYPSPWVKAEDCQTIQVGDVISVHAIANHGYGQTPLIQIMDGDWHEIGAPQSYMIWPGWPIQYDLTVNQQILDKIKNNGFIIQGTHIKFVNVTTSAPIYCTNLQVYSNNNDMGTVEYSPEQESYLKGTIVRVRAEAKLGYKFLAWSDGGALEHDIVVNENDMEIVANFTTAPKYSVKISAGDHGSLYIDDVLADYGSYETDEFEGKELNVRAVAAEGYKFTRWSDGVTTATRTITVSGEVDITAEYVESNEVTLWESSNFQTGGSGNLYWVDFSTTLVVGKTVRLYYNGPWLNVWYGQWENRSIPLQDGDGCKQFVVNDDILSKIPNGCFLQGDNTKVTLITME